MHNAVDKSNTRFIQYKKNSLNKMSIIYCQNQNLYCRNGDLEILVKNTKVMTSHSTLQFFCYLYVCDLYQPTNCGWFFSNNCLTSNTKLLQANLSLGPVFNSNLPSWADFPSIFVFSLQLQEAQLDRILATFLAGSISHLFIELGVAIYIDDSSSKIWQYFTT